MVNLYLRFPYKVDAQKLVNSICDALVGNRAFIENDIVVASPDADGRVLISLGDDADKNPKTLTLDVRLLEVSGSGVDTNINL